MPPTQLRRSAALSAAAAAAILALAGCADPGTAGAAGTAAPSATAARNGVVYNTSPEQNRLRAAKDAKLAAEVPAATAEDGKLTVATTGGSVPLSFHATDD